jgi:hypothetical protein
MEKHTKEECPRRQYECPHCQEVGEYQERTTKHLDKCPMVKVPCPRRMCKTYIKRCDLSKHRKECLFEKVTCKYSTIGCMEKVRRKDLEEHERDGQHHLQLAVDTVHQQQIKIRNMQEQCREMQAQFREIQAQSREMQAQFREMQVLLIGISLDSTVWMPMEREMIQMLQDLSQSIYIS